MVSFEPLSSIPDECVCIAFVDTTYPNFGDSEIESCSLKSKLEAELSVELEEVDIYPGASGPGWLLEVNLSDLTLAAGFFVLFFKGENVSKSLEAWISIASKIRFFLGRPACLSRSAAASLAIDEVLAVRGAETAVQIRLVRYSSADSRFQTWTDATERQIGPALEPLSVIIHVFELEVDGDRYLAVVDRTDVGVMPIGPDMAR